MWSISRLIPSLTRTGQCSATFTAGLLGTRPLSHLRILRPHPLYSTVVQCSSNEVLLRPTHTRCLIPNWKSTVLVTRRSVSSTPFCLKEKEDSIPPPAENDEPTKKGLWDQFKYLWKNYWYIVVPVEVGTSIMWMAGFYYMVASGVDVLGWVEYLEVVPSEWIDKLKSMPKGANFAIAYVIATPLRLGLTVGLTYLVIRLGARLGWFPTARQVGKKVHTKVKEKREDLSEYMQKRRDRKKPPSEPNARHQAE